MDNFEITVMPENNNERIDKFLKENLQQLSRTYIHKLTKNKMVSVNGKTPDKNYKVKANDKICVHIPQPETLEITPENIPLDIVYEDEDVLVVNKPKNMVVHPAPGHYSGTLVNALMYHCKGNLSGINGVIRPGIVHRIDKDTSGLLAVAKNDKAHKILASQIKNHSFNREYEAIVTGNVQNSQGTIRTNIGRHKIDRKKMAVLNAGGKSAITHFKVIADYKGYTHIKLILETGRTHQIRVHMAYAGHPVLGDEVYSKNNSAVFKFIKGQCLHAKTLGFVHPSAGKFMKFRSELPDYFIKALSILKEEDAFRTL